MIKINTTGLLKHLRGQQHADRETDRHAERQAERQTDTRPMLYAFRCRRDQRDRLTMM